MADAPPRARFITPAEVDRYAARANRIVIKPRLRQVVGVLEIVSPGSRQELERRFSDAPDRPTLVNPQVTIVGVRTDDLFFAEVETRNG